MKLNQSYSSLVEENKSILGWLTKTKKIYSKELSDEIDNVVLLEGEDQNVLDELNQTLRRILVKAHVEIDLTDDNESKKDCLKLLRNMHSHRKVSDLIGMLQQADS